MKKIILLGLILLVGCQDNQNLNIAAIDQQIIRLRTHIIDIADDEGVYQNELVDMQLLKEIKETTIDNAQENMNLFNDGKMTTDDLDETLEKTLSVLYFIWMEELNSAQTIADIDRLDQLQTEHNSITSEELIQSFLQKKDLMNTYAETREIFKKVPELVREKIQIEDWAEELAEIQNELEVLKADNKVSEYNEKVDVYNARLVEYESKIHEYNNQIEKYNNHYIYQTFIDLININLIFPGQENIQLTNQVE